MKYMLSLILHCFGFIAVCWGAIWFNHPYSSVLLLGQGGKRMLLSQWLIRHVYLIIPISPNIIQISPWSIKHCNYKDTPYIIQRNVLKTLSISRRHECGTWSLFCTDVPNTTSPEGTCLCEITRSGRRNSWDRRSIKSVLLISFMILKIIVINKIKFWKCYTFHAYYEWKGGMHDFDKILLLKLTEMDWNGSPNISKCAAMLFPIGQTRSKYCFGINWIVIHFISF